MFEFIEFIIDLLGAWRFLLLFAAGILIAFLAVSYLGQLGWFIGLPSLILGVTLGLKWDMSDNSEDK